MKDVKPVVENGDPEERTDMYCQYIMPHRNLSFSARNAYGLVVVSLDYQRMLRDIDTGKLLKTKSEISALKVNNLNKIRTKVVDKNLSHGCN